MWDRSGSSRCVGKSKCRRGMGCTMTLIDSFTCKPEDSGASVLLPGVSGGGRVTLKGLKRLPGVSTVCVLPSAWPPASLTPGTKAEPGKAEREGRGISRSSGRVVELDKRTAATATFRFFAEG